jgi:cell division protease FtsH
VQTIGFYIDMMCVALGAREAERMLLSDLSLGATADLESATAIARELVEVHGLGGDKLGLVQYYNLQKRQRREDLSTKTLEAIDDRVRELVEEQRARAEKIVRENRALVETLRDMLLEHKTIDAKTLAEKGPKK